MGQSVLRAVDPRETIRDSLILALESALDRAKQGRIEGFAVVLLSDSVETCGDFTDRLQMLGALQMAMFRVAETIEPL